MGYRWQEPSPDLRESEFPSLIVGKGSFTDLDDGDIGVLDTHNRGRTAGSPASSGSLESLTNLVGFIDDVIVGDDVAARIDDEARPQSSAFAGPGLVPPDRQSD